MTVRQKLAHDKNSWRHDHVPVVGAGKEEGQDLEHHELPQAGKRRPLRALQLLVDGRDKLARPGHGCGRHLLGELVQRAEDGADVLGDLLALGGNVANVFHRQAKVRL